MTDAISEAAQRVSAFIAARLKITHADPVTIFSVHNGELHELTVSDVKLLADAAFNSSARIAELEKRCPVSCNKRGTQP